MTHKISLSDIEILAKSLCRDRDQNQPQQQYDKAVCEAVCPGDDEGA